MSQGVDDFLRAAWTRDVGNDKLGNLSDDVRVGELPQSLNDDGIPRLAQPALEQSTNEIIRLDDQYATLLLHDIDVLDSPTPGA